MSERKTTDAQNTPRHETTMDWVCGWLDPHHGPLPIHPARIFPGMPGKVGITIPRVMIATGVFAASLAIMRLVPNPGIGAIIIPIWCSAFGILIDGRRGGLRGIVVAVLFPVYCAALLAIAFAAYWCYAAVHRMMSGDAFLW